MRLASAIALILASTFTYGDDSAPHPEYGKPTKVTIHPDGSKSYEWGNQPARKPASEIPPAATSAAEPAPAGQTPEPKADTPKKKGYATLQLGQSIGLSTGSSNLFTFGARLGGNIYADHSGEVAMGLLVGTQSESATISGITADVRNTAILGEFIGRHLFGSPIYAGGRAGLVLVSGTVSSGTASLDVSATSSAFGPALGAEFELASNFGAVLDAMYLATSSGTMSFSGTTVTAKYPSSSSLQLMGGLMLRF